MNKLIVNNELCIGCKKCFQSCFIDVINWDESRKRPIIAYPEECVQCMFCEMNCPVRALKVIPDYAAYAFPRDSIMYMEGGPQK